MVDERTTLIGFLRAYRLSLEMKCAGLTADQLAARSVPPSSMSLLGLIRHLADVERHWFRQVMADQEVERRYRSEDDRDADWNGAAADPAVVSEAWESWCEEVDFATGFVEDSTDLGLEGRHGDGAIQLRAVLVHMIEEYARHLGHADLLRERIDGRVGQ